MKLGLVFLILLVILLIVLPSSLAKTAPTDVQVVIPAIVVSTDSAQAQCTTPEMNPGSVVSGNSGFILVTCTSGSGGAMRFHNTLGETPTFTAVGWSQVSLMRVGFPCSFNFLNSAGSGLLGANMTNGVLIPFTNTFGSNSSLYSGGGMGYNYCLFYQNPAVTGIPSFAISWNP